MAEASMAVSDDELIAQTLAGEVSAFNELVLRWESPLYKFVYRYLGDAEASKDICQEAFIRAYDHLDRFRGNAKFSSWLYQIALNLCRSRFRRQKNRHHVPIDDGGDGFVLQLPDRRATPAERTLAQERAVAVRRALDGLPEEQRTVIVLKEHEGLKFREIAEILDLPESTAKSRLYSGLEKLAQTLGHLQPEGSPDDDAV